MATRSKNETRQDRKRRTWKPRLRRQMRRLERQAEAILAMNTDFHSRLQGYRAALLAAVRPVAMAG